MDSIVNIAAYRFVELTELAVRRTHLRSLCKQLKIKGTILLAPEGINLFLAGSREAIDTLLDDLSQDPALAQLEIKESYTDHQPFNRMLVRIKKEIISFQIDGIEPRSYTSQKLAPETLKQWLDDQRNVTLLDVRNDYEVEVGTFDQALPIGIDHFRQFPAAVAALPESIKDQPVVMFCTGGIRCEKAGPFMERAGFRKVYQLDGGILKYFEQCGGSHYRGDCFVFDKRVAVDNQLKEAATAQCYACQATLDKQQQQSPYYIEGKSCPKCYRPPEEVMADRIKQRQTALTCRSQPLPGSQPYDNRRPMNVPLRFDQHTLLDFLTQFHPQMDRAHWEQICEAGRLTRDGQPLGADQRVRAGERLIHLVPATQEPDVNADIRVLFEDDWIVVVSKPTPLPMHPCGRFNRNTLGYLLDQVYAPQKLRAAHRLDANTSGVVVLSKTRSVAAAIQKQFESGQIVKRYVALIHGHPGSDEFQCRAPISKRPGFAGIRTVDPFGLPATTEFRVQRKLDDGTSLVDVRPLTGRTNQIRVHLWDLETPIVGDPIYLPYRNLGTRQTLETDQSPLCLHAWQIELVHPVDLQSVVFSAPLPDWVPAEPRSTQPLAILEPQ